VLSLLLPAAGWTQEAPRVALFPFEIASETDLSYLQGEIPNMIEARFSEADIISELFETAGGDEAAMRTAALSRGCSHVLWGALVLEETRFTLSAFLMETTGYTPPRVFTRSDDGIENLLGAVQGLSDEIRNALVPRELIADIKVEGNARIEDEAILRIIDSKPGGEYLKQRLSDDLRAIYNMGYFDDIVITEEDSPEGKIVTFQVVEKQTVKYIEFKGNSAIRTEKLEENVDIRTGSILNIFDIKKNIQRIELQYKEKNYQSVEVGYETEDVGNNQVRLIFVIEEGEKIRIKEILFEGNEAYSDKKLKKYMKSSEKGFWSWLTSSGDYKEDMVERDVAVIDAFYKNNGYIEARVASSMETREDWIYLTFKIEEGPRYRLGDVNIEGDLIVPENRLMSLLNITDEEYYNQDVLREDMLAITDLYANFGYANAEVYPRRRPYEDDYRVDITFSIEKGNQVFFERIDISGNTRTRDKVIRRELKVNEGGLYSGAALNRSVKNLNRLDFFEEVNVNEYKGSEEDTLVLDFEVKEKATGSLSFGMGYSSYENMFFTTSVSQNNFLGKGQSVSLQAQVGSSTQQIMFKYIEPWTFDIPLTTGYTIYNWTKEYDYYDKDSRGGALSASYPFFSEDMRLFGNYSYDRASIEDIDSDASNTIWALEGTNTTSSITLGVTYDTRDRIYNATEGQDHLFSVEYAGLGGTVGFTKLTLEGSWYFPLFGPFVGLIHGEAGHVIKNPDKRLPDYERYYLGGINSLRGFDYYDVHLYDEEGAAVGGKDMVQANVELQWHILPTQGVIALLFFDTGQVFDDDYYFEKYDTGEVDDDGDAIYTGINSASFDLDAFRETAGFGIRWLSPMGPIRIEYGWLLDRREGEESGQFEFSMSNAF
jgi:outer membrane protein insertion porin family